MAQLTIGNVSADMRLEKEGYGIVDLQNLEAFLTGFVPVGNQTLVANVTTVQVLFWDAANNQVTFTVTGNIPSFGVNTMQIVAQGIVVEYGGNFQIDPYTSVLSGRVTSGSIRYTASNALIESISGINFYVSTDAATMLDISEAVELAGNDTIAAGSGNDYLLGYTGDDSMSGDGGNDTLDGGPGNDTLNGGTGNDTYLVDSSADLAVEIAGQGTDAVLASASFELDANLENLTLTGSGNLSGTGNTGNNVITGNAGNNTLDGGGGNDTLIGGAGNDSYLVGNTGVVITELAGEGEDTVRSSVNYLLGANLENLTLTGVGDLSATGNAGNNVLTGNTGNNTLDGGVGADALAGGAGSDTYLVDNAGDLVTENPNEGTDTVTSTVSYALAANVENLVLNASLRGRGIFSSLFSGHQRDLGSDGGGNDGDNLLVGNRAANRLTGGAGDDRIGAGAGDDLLIGGAGSDVLVGDRGRDTFLLDSIDGIDRIADFAAEDRLWFDHTVFGGLDLGALAQAAFASGAGLTAAQDTDDRVVHDTTSGTLYYDSDGVGAAAAVEVAVLLAQAYGPGQQLGQLDASQVWVI